MQHNDMHIIRSEERGKTNISWLNSKHTFSFGGYYNPSAMGFGYLRVLNDDVVAPGAGFGTHPHSNMEIVTYVLKGALQHKDSMGNGSTIKAGDIQRLSAGTGLTHSEYNASREEEVHFLQIWFMPQTQNTPPGYAQHSIDPARKHNALHLIASPDGKNNTISLNQQVWLHTARLDGGQQLTYPLPASHGAWLHITEGTLNVNGTALNAGDGAALAPNQHLQLAANSASADFVLMEMAGL